LFVDHLEATWAGETSLRWNVGSLTSLGGIRRGPAGEMALFISLQVVFRFGEFPAYLIIPRSGRFEKWATQAGPAFAAEVADPEHIASLVREMPVELEVILGSADLSMIDVANLRAGDVVVLRQKVNEPLEGLVAGTRKFQLWPGAVGSRAAVQVHAATDG
jgi:flagellar motor switch protein FliM